MSPFLFTEVLLQASQYTHKFTHSASKYHLPLSLSIFLILVKLIPCACQILSLSKPNKVQAFHQFHIQSQKAFYYIQLKKSKLKQAYIHTYIYIYIYKLKQAKLTSPLFWHFCKSKNPEILPWLDDIKVEFSKYWSKKILFNDEHPKVTLVVTGTLL